MRRSALRHSSFRRQSANDKPGGRGVNRRSAALGQPATARRSCRESILLKAASGGLDMHSAIGGWEFVSGVIYTSDCLLFCVAFCRDLAYSSPRLFCIMWFCADGLALAKTIKRIVFHNEVFWRWILIFHFRNWATDIFPQFARH